MNIFQFGKRHAKVKEGKATALKSSSSATSFMLEPILTPTAGIDGGNDAPNLAVFRPDETGLHLHALADVPLVLSDGSETCSSHSVVDHAVHTSEPIAHLTDAKQLPDLVTPHLPDVVDCASLHPQFESGFFTVGDTGQVSVDFVFDGGGYQGQLAIFSLDGMDHFQPGSEEFMREAAHRALSHSDLGHVVISDATDAARFSGSPGYEGDFNSGEYQGVKTFAMRPGDRVGFMLVPDGTVQQVLDNPAIDGSHRPLFSMATANPHDGLQAGQIADVTGDGNTFVFEDLRVDGHSDRDYNDVIFQLKGATGHAANLDDVIDAHYDWRSTDLGKAILSYSVPAGVEPHFDAPQANQPLVGVIDTGFSAHNPDIDYSHITLGHDWVDGDNNPLVQPGEGNDHGTHILGIIGATQDNGIGIDGINDHAPLWAGRAVESGHWADSLVEFVDAAKGSGHHNAVVNLSLDLTQINPDGSVTTRYEFTPAEYSALEYAHHNHVLIVAAAGNDGGTMSILGQASQEFDNIITVGAADGDDRADYSSFGDGLTILAPGGTVANPILSTVGASIGTMTGTSVATAEVTGAISQVWAANPALDYRQVIEILKATATDMQAPGWDLETGAGLLNIMAAVGLAKITPPENYVSPAITIPETWSGEGLVTPFDRAADIAQSVIDNLVNSLPYVEWRLFARTSIPLILTEALAAGITDLAQIAYILATSEHESHAGQLMNEIWGPTADQLTYQGRLGNTQPGDGYRYRGRGYVQITGRSNYTAWSQRLGIDLVSQPEKAVDPAIAAKIIVQGMRDGSFTGKKLSDYINGSQQDFYNARRIVNGMVASQATLIANIARRYYDILSSSGAVPPIQPPSTQITRRPYAVRAGDTLWAIAQRELGDGNRWREIQKADGSAFTEAEARTLQIGQTVYLPVKYTVGTGVPVTPAPVTSPTPVSVGSLSPSPALFQDAYDRAGGAASGWTPTGHAYRWGNGWTQEFRNANGDRMLLLLEDGADKAYIVFGSNLVEYEFMGGPVGRDLDGRRVELGYPRSDENIFQQNGTRAVWQAFAGENGKARIHNSYGFASVATWGTIGGLYTDMGGAGSFLGMPTRREYFDGDTVFADFQGGRIAYNWNTGKIEALHGNEQPSWRQSLTQTGRVNARVGSDPLNFRNRPEVATDDKIGELAVGASFQVLRSMSGGTYNPGTGDRNDWLEIKLSDGRQGYVAAYYVDTVSNNSNNGNPASAVNPKITSALDSLNGIVQIRDPNGNYPGQCVSFVKRYTQKLGLSMGAMGGNGGAKYGFINFNVPGLSLSTAQADKITFTGNETPKVGDIIFFNSTASNAYGHTAVIQSVLPNGRVVIEESNGNGKANTTGTSVTRREISLTQPMSGYGAVMGWLHPKL